MQFNQVIYISKSGLRVVDVFSHLFNVHLAFISIKSCKGNSDDVKNQQGQFIFLEICQKLLQIYSLIILLEDDLADSWKY